MQGTRQNKIEKADILEMTVRHLRTVHKNKSMGMCIFFQLSFINFKHILYDSVFERPLEYTCICIILFFVILATDERAASRINKYRLGFSECASEVSQYLENIDGVETEFRSRLLNHLTTVTMSSDQDSENSDSQIPSMPGQQMQDHIHRKGPNCNSAANVDRTHSRMTTNQSVETQNEANQRVNGKTCDASEWSSIQNPNSMANNLLYNTPSTKVSAASGQVAYLVPASSLLQYNNAPVPCSNVFIRLVQPININTSSAPCISSFVVATSSPNPAYVNQPTIANLQTEQKLTFQPHTVPRINDGVAFQSTDSVQRLNNLTTSHLDQNKKTISLSSTQFGQNDSHITKEITSKEAKGTEMWRPW